MDVQTGNAPGVQHAGANAVVQGKPTDPQPIDSRPRGARAARSVPSNAE